MQWLLIPYSLISIFLSIAILMQNRGGGLGGSFGGSGSYHTRRGIEKTLFSLTIILVVLFTGFSIVVLL